MAYNTYQISGQYCKISQGGTDVNFSSAWSVEISGNIVDAPTQGEGWVNKISGQFTGTGSMEYYFVPAAASGQSVFIDNVPYSIPWSRDYECTIYGSK